MNECANWVEVWRVRDRAHLIHTNVVYCSHTTNNIVHFAYSAKQFNFKLVMHQFNLHTHTLTHSIICSIKLPLHISYKTKYSVLIRANHFPKLNILYAQFMCFSPFMLLFCSFLSLFFLSMFFFSIFVCLFSRTSTVRYISCARVQHILEFMFNSIFELICA